MLGIGQQHAGIRNPVAVAVGQRWLAPVDGAVAVAVQEWIRMYLTVVPLAILITISEGRHMPTNTRRGSRTRSDEWRWGEADHDLAALACCFILGFRNDDVANLSRFSAREAVRYEQRRHELIVEVDADES